MSEQKRFGSNLTDDELEEIKRAIRLDERLRGVIQKYCPVGFTVGSPHYLALSQFARQIRADANDPAISTAIVDLVIEAQRLQDIDPDTIGKELLQMEREEVRAGRSLPNPDDRDAMLEMWRRARQKPLSAIRGSQ